MKHKARKRFGQNFLQSQSIIHQILNSMHLQQDDKVIEIGPGLGALTQPLLGHLKNLTAIEIDTDLHAYLAGLPIARDKLNLLSADALTVDYSQWGKQLRIIGNLPYNISTPLLLHLLKFTSLITDMHFMLQKEVVSRLVAKPGNKTYGRLSIMVQYHCQTEYLFDVPPEAFHPKPKVNSALVRLIPYSHSPYLPVSVDSLQRLVAQAFSMRRKTLANNLKSILNTEALNQLGINPLARPEQISVHDYVNMVDFINK